MAQPKGEVPAILKKYFPNGRPASLEKLFPAGPPPAEWFLDVEPGEMPPKFKEAFPDGLPEDLNIFKEGNMPEDFKQFLIERGKELRAQAEAAKAASA